MQSRVIRWVSYGEIKELKSAIEGSFGLLGIAPRAPTDGSIEFTPDIPHLLHE